MVEDVHFSRVVEATLDHFDAAMAVFKEPGTGLLVNVPRVTIPSDARPGAVARVKTGVRPHVVAWVSDAPDAEAAEMDTIRDLLGGEGGA